MNTVLTPREPQTNAEAALAQTGLAAAGQAGPLVVATGAPWRVIWVNAKAEAVFGTQNHAELTRILFTGAQAGARQFARLAERMEAGAAPADLRLRLMRDRKQVMLTLSCAKFSAPMPLLAIAPWGVPADAFNPEPAVQTIAAAERVGEDNPADANAPAQSLSAADAAPVATTRKVLTAAEHGAKVRFLWRTDRAGKLTGITGPLCEFVGCEDDELIGANFGELAQSLGLDPDGRMREALDKRETWSGIEVMWPVRGASKRVPIVLGGLPGFSRAREFDGFSGFGVIHSDRIAESADAEPQATVQRAEDAAAPAEPAATIDATKDGTAAIATPPPTYSATPTPIADNANIHAQPAAKSDQAADTAGIDAQDMLGEADAGTAPGLTQIDLRATSDASETPHEEAPHVEAPAARARALNVVPLRPWQKDPRGQTTVTETPHFVRPNLEDAMPAAERSAEKPVERAPASAESSAPAPTKSADELVGLSPAERNAFREIARALGARGEKIDPPARDIKLAEPNLPASETATAAADEGEKRAAAAMPAFVMPIAQAPAAQTAGRSREADDIRNMIDRIDSGLLVARAGVPAFLNKTLLDLLGYRDIDEFYGSGGVERMFRGRDPEILSGEAGNGAIPVVAANGEVLALEGRVKRIEWDGEAATLMTLRPTQAPELAARAKALELEMQKRDGEIRELHAILDTATDGVALLDNDGKILSLNRSAQALFGIEQNEVAGEMFTELLGRDSHAAALDYLNGLKSNGVKSVLNDGREVNGRARQGGAIPMFMTLGRVGTSIEPRFCAVLRDLTSWKKVERELGDAKRDAERASALKSDFLAKISHEIRTPLNAIIGFAEVIMDERFGPVGNERYRDYLKDIHNSGAHVLSLVNDLLDLSKIEAGKLDLDFTSVNANKIVNECVSIIQAQATRERVIVRLSLAPRLPNIVSDERSLRQIVLNILSNAVKFNEPGGQVIVSTALTDSGHAVIRVRDTGIGMSERELEMAIEPFRQIATSRQTTGTGLGLPLTKALVEANRATFIIKSRKGEGTLVEVAFPPTRVLAE